MEDLIIDSTKSTPQIIFSVKNGTLEIKGDCYPAYPFNFFKKLLKWIDSYFLIKTDAELILKINYLNTTSSKSIYNMLDKLETYMKTGKEIKISWFYEAEEGMYEEGQRILSKFQIPYKFIEVKRII